MLSVDNAFFFDEIMPKTVFLNIPMWIVTRKWLGGEPIEDEPVSEKTRQLRTKQIFVPPVFDAAAHCHIIHLILSEASDYLQPVRRSHVPTASMYCDAFHCSMKLWVMTVEWLWVGSKQLKSSALNYIAAAIIF